ncbi:hypothetical protein [Streptomyces sp. 5-10]|uniref:beta barrel domain-containing protein n=1 Tax=Streptomyces sp. 5-10 TaxID=878925 RepID=UPI00168B5C32|nr:hypothetical protein [Streptomyces sp. 5-10]MBD3004792.1 hypothetical protein [Streptomyces sp. 5-10]
MTRLEGIRKGDPLILVGCNRLRGNQPVTVSRVGRSYIYVNDTDGSEMRRKFDRETGAEVDACGSPCRLYTQVQYDERKQRQELLDGLLAAGIKIDANRRSDISTDKLRALLDVMKAD